MLSGANRPVHLIEVVRQYEYYYHFRKITILEGNVHCLNRFSRNFRFTKDRPLGYKTFFTLNSNEHEIETAHKI